MIFWLLLACNDEAEKRKVEPDTGGESEILGGPDAPDLSTEEVEALFQSNVGAGLPTAIQLRSLYGSFLSQRENNCPAMENQNSSTWHGVWFDDCTTSSGYHFWGTALYFEFTEGNSWSFVTIFGF